MRNFSVQACSTSAAEKNYAAGERVGDTEVNHNSKISLQCGSALLCELQHP